MEALSYPLADHALARRLERAEAVSNARFVESRAARNPEIGAAWIEVGGAYAMYDGGLSPCTQTFGLGLFESANDGDLDTIEAFYRQRDSPVYHEVSPLADKALPPLLSRRGYEPFEFTSVMSMPIDVARLRQPPPSMNVRLVGTSEHALWAGIAAKGWMELEGIAEQIFDLALVIANRPDVALFLAELDGKPVATGALSIDGGVGLLAGASTIPEARNRGAQHALLMARLRHASGNACDLAMMCAEPGSSSQRNAERQGFRIAYTRMKWRLRDSID